MSDESKSISEQASVAPGDATLRRSIVMSWFRGPMATSHKVAAENTAKTLGQVVGRIVAVSEREGRLPNGDPSVSLVATGRFEAVNYDTGEVVQAATAYLPRYFLEAARDILARDPASPGLDFAVEIVLVPTGKSIPVAYEVKPLLQAPADDPVEVMKRQLQAANRLRLPAPREPERLALPGELHEAPPAPAKGKGATKAPAEAQSA